ncbi:CAP domain-containing protein [Limimaricola sp. G21655-S1]|uniref:CAP domain-containing protein n=1 Tax=Limimaricola sp. G21655-S1 TaxID=3014768 RepID=UPI0022AF71CF|nr:CAP domain-containing protein [Limimaricola sp. G21655-S1]MCZ4261708.1 CAP domain-containing protein [Limimaricola sp. G21655-S1]
MSIANDLERQMLSLINEERSTLGLSSLKLELNLNDSSEDHSNWMLQSDTFSHTGQGGSSATDRMRAADFDFSGSWASGENLAWQSERGASGLSDDVVDLHESLMNSPGHRANILNPDFEYVGIGIERGDFKGWDGVMVTQNFARTGGQVDLDNGASTTPSDTSAPQNTPVAQDTAPVVTVDDVTLGKAKGGYRTRLDKHLEVADTDGDAIKWFELRDTAGRDNFIFKGQGRIDADDGVRIAADDLDMIRLRVNRRLGETELEVRASDGQDSGEWEVFTLTTLSAEDWLA